MGKRLEQRFLQGRYTNGNKHGGKMVNIINYSGHANQSHTDMPFHTYQNDQNFKKQKITSVSKDLKRLESFYFGDEYIKFFACCGKQLGSFSKVKPRTAI